MLGISVTGKAKYYGDGTKSNYKRKKIIAYRFIFGFEKTRFGINSKCKL